MKKILAILLVLTMALALAVPTFAAPTDEGNLFIDYTAADWGNDKVKYDSDKGAITVTSNNGGDSAAIIGLDNGAVTSGKYVVEYDIYADLNGADADQCAHLNFLNKDNTNFFQFTWSYDNQNLYLNGTYTVDGTEGEWNKTVSTEWFEADTYKHFKVELDIDNGEVKAYLDGELIATVTAFRADFNGFSGVQFWPREKSAASYYKNFSVTALTDEGDQPEEPVDPAEDETEAPAEDEAPVETPAEDEAPAEEETEAPAETGLALVIAPMIVAMAAAALTKKKR